MKGKQPYGNIQEHDTICTERLIIPLNTNKYIRYILSFKGLKCRLHAAVHSTILIFSSAKF